MLDQPLFAAVKARLADVPGIDGMSVSNIAGRMQFGMDGKIAAVDENASDAEIDAAIRATFGGKTVTDTTITTAAPAAAATPVPAAPSPVTAVPKTPALPSNVTGAAHVGTTLKDMLTQRKSAMIAAHEKLSANFAKLDVATEALNTVADNVGGEADDLMATLGQFTNDLG